MIYDHKNLPAEYHSQAPVKCGFGVKNELALQSKEKPFLKIAKPSSQFVYIHAFVIKGQPKRFHIHYDTTGADKVTSLDANSNGLPDWVEETGRAMEKAYRTAVDTLGYREPPNFPIYGFYNVYILEQGSFYGSTTPDSAVTTNPWTYTSYIEVDNDFAGNFYTKGYNALRVTCAHEFHHAVQLAYQNTYSSGDGWFYEVTSTWMEDVVYPEVNDYIDYLKYYFNQPHISLNVANGSHEYAMAIWNHYIQKQFNRLMIRRVWEKIPSMSALEAWNQVLIENSNFSLSNAYPEFVKWNYFTGYRADTIHYYQEGYLYPMVKWQAAAALTDSLSFSNTLKTAASRWYLFSVFDQTNAELRFSGLPANSHYTIMAIKKRPSTAPVVYTLTPSTSILIEQLNPSDSLIIAVINKTWNSSELFSFQFSAKPTTAVLEDLDLKVYPNPLKIFSQTDRLRFSFRLSKRMDVSFEIYSVSGIQVYKSDRTELLPDLYWDSKALSWDCRDNNNKKVPSGVYIYQFKYGKKIKTGKIAVIR